MGEKEQLDYFEQYLDKQGAKTFVIERPYTDRDYLADYAAYYVKCFGKYGSRCSRIHLFDSDFSQTDFEEAAARNSKKLTDENLQEAYLGFTVVKPLPITFIGRTCLKTYDAVGPYGDDPDRVYPVARHYEVHLLGMKFAVNSLAWQEQDTVVAACATSALWSAFHGTGKLFQHNIPSPVEITSSATVLLPSATRNLPSHGLTLDQMASAIRNLGLEPEEMSIKSKAALQRQCYAYLRANIPLIMPAAVYDSSQSDPVKKGPRLMGWHAVTVTGYGMKDTFEPDIFTDTVFRASSINRLFVHDDGRGPFARMEFQSPLKFGPKGEEECIPMVVGYRDSPFKYVPYALLIPLYNKIRIRYEKIESEIGWLHGTDKVDDKALDGASTSNIFEWDVFLSSGNDMKADVRNTKSIPVEYQLEFLKSPLPRFVWRAIARLGNEPIMEVFYDATDIDQGDYLQGVIAYDFDRVQRFAKMVKEGVYDVLLKHFPPSLPRSWVRFKQAKTVELALMPRPLTRDEIDDC